MEEYHLIPDPVGTILYDPDTITFYRLTGEGEKALKNGSLQMTIVSQEKQRQETRPSPLPAPQFLERLVLIVTTECNLRCRYCYADGGSYGMPSQPMPVEVALQTIRWAEAFLNGIGVIQFFGGEPSLNPRVIRAACEHLERSSFAVRPGYGIVTNGVYLPKELLDIVQQYNFQVTFSIDGPAEVHDLHRVRRNGRGSFDAVRSNLDRVRACGVGVGIEMTFTPQAAEHGYGVWELAKFSVETLGIQEPHIVPVCTKPDSLIRWHNGNRVSLVESYRVATDQAFHSFLTSPYPVTFTLFLGLLRILASRKGRDVICPAGITTLAVDPEGDIYPCFMFAGQDEYRLGNVFSSEREAFWSRLERFNHFNWKANRSECCSCWARKLCTGCMGNIQTSNGSLEGVWGPMCDVMKAIAEETMRLLAFARENPSLWEQFVARYRTFRLRNIPC